MSTKWSISFDIKQIQTPGNWACVFLSTATDSGAKDIGYRIPSVHIGGNDEILIYTSTNDSPIQYFQTKIRLNVYVSVVIQQRYVSAGKYRLSVFKDGEEFGSVINENAKIFHDVKMYRCNPYLGPPSKAYVKNLKFTNFL